VEVVTHHWVAMVVMLVLAVEVVDKTVMMVAVVQE
jgi:hypothetical protein